MKYDDFEENEGCCLKCEEAEPGCLCFECKCKDCDDYSSGGYNAQGEYGGYCTQRIFFEEQAEKAKEEMAQNIVLNYTTEFGNTVIQVKTVGPVIKDNYAKIKPFLIEHFRYDYEKKCYYVFSENWRFIRRVRFALQNAGFDYPETLDNEPLETSYELPYCYFEKVDLCDCQYNLDCHVCKADFFNKRGLFA